MTDTSQIFEYLKTVVRTGQHGGYENKTVAVADAMDELQRIYDEITVLTGEDGSPYEIEHRQERARNKLRQAELLLSLLPLLKS